MEIDYATVMLLSAIYLSKFAKRMYLTIVSSKFIEKDSQPLLSLLKENPEIRVGVIASTCTYIWIIIMLYVL